MGLDPKPKGQIRDVHAGQFGLGEVKKTKRNMRTGYVGKVSLGLQDKTKVALDIRDFCKAKKNLM